MLRTHGCLLLAILLLTLPNISAATEVKEWTFLVFLNGHNDLDQYGASNMKQMERVGSTDKVNVVVQWASMASPTTKRIYVRKSTNAEVVTSPAVEELSPVDMGNPNSLIEFVRWAKERYPARHYFIDVWNHGSGWHRINKMGGEARQDDISWDERFNSHITTKQLGAAMQVISRELGQKVDVYGSDACLMAMAEVAGEMKNSVEVFVGAEETEPGDGWPYDQLLAEWNKKERATASDVGQILVREYVKAYSGGQFGKEEVTLSAMKMAHWSRFESAFKNFSSEMRNLDAAERAAVLRVAANTQAYQYSDYKDLFHFTQGLAAANLSSVAQSSLSRLQATLNELILENGVTGEYRNSRGISLWIPDTRYQYDTHAKAYQGLAFHQATSWGQVLARLFPKK